jgi:predicted metal-dependent enzyme (double-stranded beta helix superfamily)
MPVENLVSQLRSGVDAALRESPDIDAAMERIKIILHDLVENGECSLPAEFQTAPEDHYARRLLYDDRSNGTSAVVMTWGPGQATPIHDHAGVWCVECVIAGTMEVRRFDLRERDGELCRFVPSGTVTAAVGSTGALIPPFEYHVLANLSDQPSLTLHIYGADMTECHIYKPSSTDGWHVRIAQRLEFTA